MTHAEHSMSSLKIALEKHGCNVLHFPLISISESEVDINKDYSVYNYNWIIFTSKYGVQYFFNSLSDENLTLLKDNDTKFACIGMFTSNRLRQFGFESSLVSDIYNSDTFSVLLKQTINSNDKVLLALGELAHNKIKNELSHVATVDRINIYKNTPLKVDKKLKEIILNKEYDRIVFASPSAVESLKNQIDDSFYNIDTKAVAIGQTTANCLRSNKINNIFTANNERNSLLETIVSSL